MANNDLEQATFGAGCFWYVEEVFRRIDGVESAAVGFMGGDAATPTYEQVCGGNTGHAEVVQMEFNPEKVSYKNLLNFFWENHDPTTPNRQGPDVGEQYRSVIFYHTPEQKKLAEKSVEEIDELGKFPDPVVTQILPAEEFYKAEEYHQQYLVKQKSDAHNTF